MSWPTFFEKRVDIIKEVRNFRGAARVLKAEAQAAAGGYVRLQRIEGVYGASFEP